jgi:hypothetical protein
MAISLWACGGPPQAQAPEPDTVTNTAPARIRLCHAPGRCTGDAATPDTPDAMLSPDERYAFVLDLTRSTPAVLDIYEVATIEGTLRAGRRVARVKVPDEAAQRATAAQARWAAGNHVWLGWGAGTGAASGILYDQYGAVRLEVAASAIDVSPSGLYLATFPTMLADDPTIEILDLTRNGALVASNADPTNAPRAVQTVEWTPDAFVARYRDHNGQTGELRIPLATAP